MLRLKVYSMLALATGLMLVTRASGEESLFDDRRICRTSCQNCPSVPPFPVLHLASGMHAITLPWTVPQQITPRLGAYLNLYGAGKLAETALAIERRVVACEKDKSLSIEVTPAEAVRILEERNLGSLTLKYSFLDTKPEG